MATTKKDLYAQRAAEKGMPDLPEPQDHLPKNPARDEARARDLVVSFGGAEYVITRAAADNLEIYEMVEDDKAVSALRAFLGTEQWAAWKDRSRNEAGVVPMATFQQFMNCIMESIGGN